MYISTRARAKKVYMRERESAWMIENKLLRKSVNQYHLFMFCMKWIPTRTCASYGDGFELGAAVNVKKERSRTAPF